MAAILPYIPAIIGGVSALAKGLSGSGPDGPRPQRQPGGMAYTNYLNQYMTDPSQWAQYYPGQTYASVNPYESGGAQGLGQYGQNLEGAADPYLAANTAAATGQTAQGNYGQNFAGLAQAYSPGIFQGPNAIRQPGFNPRQYQQSYGNPNAAFSQQLSGQADYSGLGQAFQAAMNPLYQQFNNVTMPGLTMANNAATGGQGGSGVLKSSQRALQDINTQGANMASTMAFNEQQAAQQRQLQAAGQVGTLNQAGLQTGANIANMGAGLNLQTQLANQAGQESYANRLLSAAQQGGTMLNDTATTAERAQALAPQTFGLGALPYAYQTQAGAQQRAIDTLPITADMARYNYNQQLPWNAMTQGANALKGWVGPGSGAGGPQTNAGVGNSVLGALLTSSAFWPQQQGGQQYNLQTPYNYGGAGMGYPGAPMSGGGGLDLNTLLSGLFDTSGTGQHP